MSNDDDLRQRIVAARLKLRERFQKSIEGTPAMVIERLGAISSELQLDGILAELNCGGQVPREGVVGWPTAHVGTGANGGEFTGPHQLSQLPVGEAGRAERWTVEQVR